MVTLVKNLRYVVLFFADECRLSCLERLPVPGFPRLDEEELGLPPRGPLLALGAPGDVLLAGSVC